MVDLRQINEMFGFIKRLLIPRPPSVGEELALCMQKEGLTVPSLAYKASMLQETIQRLLNDDAPVTGYRDACLCRVFGSPQGYWLDIQKKHNDWKKNVA